MSSLLAAKFYRPSIPTKWVERARLTGRLEDGRAAGRRLTLISAPAGFGKTACACAWLDRLGLPAAWLSLDPADDDPGRFFTYLIAALQKVVGGLGSQIESVLRSGQLPPAEVISTALINELLGVPGRFLLVLDDFQVIQDPFILRVFETLFAALFQGGLEQPLHLVLLTREDPALPLARLRAANQMTELRAHDLRFDSQEAARFLNEQMGLGLSAADVAALEERTEGWIAGLQLAAIALSSRPVSEREGAGGSTKRFIATLKGSHRYILGYLTEEVLDRQPAEIRQFLLQTAILDRLSGDLCDAVTGRVDSRRLLEHLLNANLFLVPLDEEQRWYRYHHLFADLLRDLYLSGSKAQAAELHRRASRWYAQAAEEGGSADSVRVIELAGQAIQHALAAGDYPGAVSLIERHVTGMLVQWYAKLVNEWLQAIPLTWRGRSPKTNLAFAWLHLLKGDFAQAQPYLERLTGIFSAAPPDDSPSLLAEWLALQATLLSAQGKPAESLALAQQALAIVPEQDVYVRSLIYLGQAGAFEQMGEEAKALEAYQKLIQHGRAAGSLVSELLGLTALARTALFHGQLHFAFATAWQALEQIERSGTLPPIATAVHGEIGQIYYQWHQLEQAHQHFERAVQVSALSGYNDAALYQGVILARLHLIEGRAAEAAQQIEKVVEQMQVSAPAAVGKEVVYQQVWIALAQGRLAAAETVLQPFGFSFQDPPTLPETIPGQPVTHPLGLLYACALRVLLYRAQTRGELAGLRRGLDLANWLLEAARRRQDLPLVLTTLLLRAQMHSAQGSEQPALADAGEAVALGEPEGFISVFIEEGRPVEQFLVTLLAQKRISPALAEYGGKILAAFASHRPAVAARPTPERRPGADLLSEPASEALTDRELEVLALIAEGLKYREIAERLVVSLNTVRTHVKAIYGKLGINSATQAVEEARRLNWI